MENVDNGMSMTEALLEFWLMKHKLKDKYNGRGYHDKTYKSNHEGDHDKSYFSNGVEDRG